MFYQLCNAVLFLLTCYSFSHGLWAVDLSESSFYVSMQASADELTSMYSGSVASNIDWNEMENLLEN